MKKKRISLVLLASLCLFTTVHAQTELGRVNDKTKNYISTGMPILLIAPDAVSGAMGDAGVASRPDAYSGHWNNAKFAFIEDDLGFSTTYTPWLRNLGVGDMNLLYLAGYKRINDRSTAAISLTYFSLGDIERTNEEGVELGNMHPNEFAVDLSYALKLTDNLSLGATGRLNHSDLTNGQDVGTQQTKAANSLAADVGLYYQTDVDKSQQVALGMLISNLGAKLSYSDDDTEKEFLPSNLRLGGRYSNEIDKYNKINILFDINKLLVPTPPIQKTGESDKDYSLRYKDYNNTGVMQGAIQALYDAPGGFKEKMQELQLSGGAEYWYNDMFAARAGYFFEHSNKGGRQYVTVGFGIRYNIFAADFAYLIPTTQFGNNPLTNTIRISLSVNFANDKK